MDFCPLCKRPLIPGASTDRHHLIPKSLGGSEQFLLHKICYRKIHSLFTERELKRSYSTFKLLLEHPEIIKFVKWVQKKPPEFMDKNITANRKRR